MIKYLTAEESFPASFLRVSSWITLSFAFIDALVIGGIAFVVDPEN